jgi:hypothetical protein
MSVSVFVTRQGKAISGSVARYSYMVHSSPPSTTPEHHHPPSLYLQVIQ